MAKKKNTVRTAKAIFSLPDVMITPIIQLALAEDLGRRGDITSQAIIPVGTKAKLAIVSREDGILAGMDLARLSFTLCDPKIKFKTKAQDGDRIQAGQVLAIVKGDAHALL